jgi:hypothetical protein
MRKSLLVVFLCTYCVSAFSQTTNNTSIVKKKKNKRTYYFSWGYNSEAYTKSNIYVNQPSLGNDYKMVQVNARDHQGWNDGIFNKALTIPQYNYRLGCILNEEKGWGIELNFDHTKYLIQEPQNVRIKGSLSGEPVDSTINFQENNGFYYYLNNGANFFLINIVKHWHWMKDKSGHIKVDVLAKAGIGPVVPHVEDEFFGHPNDPHFQIGGWNTGVEGTIKLIFYDRVFLEFCNKADYARYSGLKIYEGKVHQAFGTYEMILNLGVMLRR